jgi:hypothetical protein
MGVHLGVRSLIYLARFGQIGLIFRITIIIIIIISVMSGGHRADEPLRRPGLVDEIRPAPAPDVIQSEIDGAS